MRYLIVEEDDGDGYYVKRLSDNTIVSKRHLSSKKVHRLARQLEQKAAPNPNQKRR